VLDNGKAGVLVAAGSPTALSTALDELLDDPERRAELAAAGQRRAAMWDWPVVARRVLQVYEGAVAADPRRLRSGPGAGLHRDRPG
jgi:phosphatidylinositol alpha-mannosyltransferase